MGNVKAWGGTLALCSMMSACAVPKLSVPTENGYPSIRTIVDRITCEMVEMIKHDDFNDYGFRTFLVSGDYVASMRLSLSTTESGGLSPKLNFPNFGTNVSMNVGLSASQSRSHAFSRNMRFAFRELYDRVLEDDDFGECPQTRRTGLSGELGIKEIVRLQNTARTTLTSGATEKSEAFTGTISFTIKRDINSAGPTWVLTNFVGPGGLGSAAKSSTNKLVIAFAPGSKPADFAARASRSDVLLADQVLRDEIIAQSN